MSEMWGRLPLYHTCQALFIVFNMCCAASNNLTVLIVFRFLAGCAGSSPITLGAGTIADIMPPEKRGAAMSIWMIGPSEWLLFCTC